MLTIGLFDGGNDQPEGLVLKAAEPTATLVKKLHWNITNELNTAPLALNFSATKLFNPGSSHKNFS